MRTSTAKLHAVALQIRDHLSVHIAQHGCIDFATLQKVCRVHANFNLTSEKTALQVQEALAAL